MTTIYTAMYGLTAETYERLFILMRFVVHSKLSSIHVSWIQCDGIIINLMTIRNSMKSNGCGAMKVCFLIFLPNPYLTHTMSSILLPIINTLPIKIVALLYSGITHLPLAILLNFHFPFLPSVHFLSILFMHACGI